MSRCRRFLETLYRRDVTLRGAKGINEGTGKGRQKISARPDALCTSGPPFQVNTISPLRHGHLSSSALKECSSELLEAFIHR